MFSILALSGFGSSCKVNGRLHIEDMQLWNLGLELDGLVGHVEMVMVLII